jgi:hypothetical protein
MGAIVNKNLNIAGTSGASADLRSRDRERVSRAQSPIIRLASVAVMDEADQRRLELLLDHLIERRVSRLLQREGT